MVMPTVTTPDGRVIVGVDCEGSPTNPISLQLSVTPGTGYVIRAGDQPAIQRFHQWLLDNRDRILVSVHYAMLNDFAQLRNMGIDLIADEIPLCDTGILSYVLCVTGGGLKALCYKFAGMHQDSYEDTIGGVGRDIALEYLHRVDSAADAPQITITPDLPKLPKPPKRKKKESDDEFAVRMQAHDVIVAAKLADSQPYTIRQWPDPEPELVYDGNGCRVKKPVGVGKLVRRILADVEAGKTLKDGEPVDPRERWKKLDPRTKAPVVEAIGDMREPTLDDIPYERAITYSARDSDCQLRITRPLLDRVHAMDLDYVVQLDHSVLPIIDRMAQAGIQLAPPKFWDDLDRRCDAQMESAKFAIYKATGREINPGSGDQVAKLLYGPKSEGGLGLTPPMMTDGGESGKIRGSTNDKCLEDLLPSAPVVEHVESYREAAKLKGTYIAPLREMSATGDHRAHTTFKITRQHTGRFTTAEPINLLSIPTRSELGNQCRFGFVAPDGKIMYDSDESTVEFRTFAHLSRDEALCKIMWDDTDIHTMTASGIFSRKAAEVEKWQRQAAKVCIAEGQLVLTDQGLVPIEKMTLGHKVWDGVEWVRHAGLVDKGVREVIEYDEVTATPDHEVYTDQGLISLREAALSLARLKTTGVGREAIRIGDCDLAGAETDKGIYMPQTSVRVLRRGFLEDQGEYPETRIQGVQIVQPDEIQVRGNTGGSLHGNPTAVQHPSLPWIQGLRGAGNRVPILFLRRVCQVRGDSSAPPDLSRDHHRPDRQRRPLRTRQSSAGYLCDPEFEHAAECVDGVPGEANSGARLRQPLSNRLDPAVGASRYDGGADYPERYRARPEGKKVENVEAPDRVVRRSRVYDLLNAGPRHRFTVSGKLVHNCGFGIINGISAHGLAIQLILYRAAKKDGSRWTEDDCQIMLDEWFKMYPGAKRFQQECIAETRSTGLARDPLSGRIRYLPQIWSPIPSVAAEAERCSFSHLIQTSANTILKRAMAAIWRELRDEREIVCVLPPHDEVLFELPDTEEHRALVDTVVPWALTQTTKLRVPLKAEGGFGDSWGTAKH